MDNLLTEYKKRFSFEDASFEIIEHEDAIIATVYKVSLPNGREYILKIPTREEHYLCEVYFLRYFANKLPVPQVIKFVEPGTDIQGAILMEFLPGTLLKLSEFTDSQAYEIGSLLAKIHVNKATAYGDLTQPDSLSTNPSHYFLFKFEEGLTECSQHLPNALLEKAQRYCDDNIKLLSLVDGPCITHRDFRPGNVIINEGKIQGIIDWSGGRASFAEEDFCPLEFGEWSSNNARKQSFLKGYASIRPVPNYDAIMPLLCLSRAIATLGFTVKSHTWENINANLYQRNRRFLDEFFRIHS